MTGTPVRPVGAKASRNVPGLRGRLRDRLVTHLETGRPDLVFYSGFVGIAGVVLASRDWTVWQMLGAWAAPTFGWFAAMYGGDYFDRELDSLSKSQRPIPSGRMRPRTAFVGMIVYVVLGMVIAVALDPLNLLLVVAALALGVCYSKFLKTRGAWGNVSRGAITACAFYVGVLATDNPPLLLLLPVALVFWLHDAASNVLGAICDMEGDRRGGYRTFAVRHGERASLRLMVALHALWVLLAVVYPVVALDDFDLTAYFGVLTVAVLMAAGSVVMCYRSRPMSRLAGLRAHEVLVLERLVLVAAFVAGAAGLGIGLGLVVPFLAATVLASVALMRASYEPSRGWRRQRDLESPA